MGNPRPSPAPGHTLSSPFSRVTHANGVPWGRLCLAHQAHIAGPLAAQGLQVLCPLRHQASSLVLGRTSQYDGGSAATSVLTGRAGQRPRPPQPAREGAGREAATPGRASPHTWVWCCRKVRDGAFDSQGAPGAAGQVVPGTPSSRRCRASSPGSAVLVPAAAPQ